MGTGRESGFNDGRENLVILAILGILIAVAVPNFWKAMALSKATKDLETIANAEKKYRAAHGTWLALRHEASPEVRTGCEPSSIPELDVNLKGACVVEAVMTAGSNGELVLRASGGRMGKTIERVVKP